MKVPSAFPALFLVPVLGLAAPDPVLVNQAQAGDPASQLQLAEVLFESLDDLEDEAAQAKSRAEALQYLRSAATRGYAAAQARLASYLEENREHTDANKAEAASWMRKAADQGHAYAQQRFGFWAADGTGTKRDLATAVKYLRLAAAAGDGDARRYLIGLFSTGEDMFGNKGAVDLKEAIKWQERESLAPDAPSYKLPALARLYLMQPDVTPAQRAKAEKIIAESLADGGSIDEEMRRLLGEAKAEELAPRDPIAAFRKKAQAGDAGDQLHFFNLVEEYAPLDGPLMKEAYDFLVRAATNGNVQAQYRLAKFLASEHPVGGAIVDADLAAAAPWYRKAAEQKHVEAMIEWGLTLAGGYVVKKDFPGALRYLREAALAGDAKTQQYLADLYRNGEDPFENKVPVDVAEALKWQRMLVKAGDETAYAVYGELLAKLPQPDRTELAEAVKLLEKLVADGAESSRPALDAVRIKSGLPPTAPPQSVAAAAPAETAPTIPAAAEKEADWAALKRRFATFVEQFNSATTIAGRARTFWTFERWVRSESSAELSEKGDWIVREMQPLLERHPGEAFSLLSAAAKTLINDDTIKRALPEALQKAYFDGRDRVVAVYRAEEKYRDAIRQNWNAAHAGDAQAQMAMAVAYASRSDAMETSGWAHAIHWFGQAAGKGVAGAADQHRKWVDRANARLKAAGAAKDMPTIIEMYRQKAASPLPDAHVGAFLAGQALLGGGEGEAEDIPEAVSLLTSAADKGHVPAWVELGQLYVVHHAQPIDEVKALGWFRKAAEAGDKQAKGWVEVLAPALSPAERGKLAYKVGGEQMRRADNVIDFGPAMPFSRFAARLGNPDAVSFMASQYYESDPERAGDMYQRAAEGGSVAAMSMLASAYANGEMGLAKNRAKAREWILRAAAAGGMWEKNSAGIELQTGANGPIDFAAAKKWFLEAAALGQYEALYHLGEMWFDGKLPGGSDAEAVAWWTKAAENGIEEAQHRLALLYLRGQGGLAKDQNAARRWLVKAADFGYEPAQAELRRLGGATATAAGTSQSRSSAASSPTFDQDLAASITGDADAMYRMGQRYEKGEGVALNLKEALAWYEKAAALNHADADDAATEVGIRLQRQEDEKIARQMGAMKQQVDAAASAAEESRATTVAEDTLGNSKNDPESAFRLGKRYETGDGVEKNTEIAIFFYNRAERLGHPRAAQARLQLTTAIGLSRMAANLPKPDAPTVAKPTADGAIAAARSFARMGSQEDATKMIQQAVQYADTASPANRHFLSRVLFRGEYGVRADQARALRLIQESAEAGYVPAQLEWGQIVYQGGFGVKADQAKGQEWFVKAAATETNDPEVMMSQANLFVRGAPGVPPDRARAWRLVARAANDGLPAAELEYGRTLVTGAPDIPAEPARGIAYLEKAANRGLPQAAFALGEIYEKGTGVPINLEQAQNWYTAAAKANPEARGAVDRVRQARRQTK